MSNYDCESIDQHEQFRKITEQLIELNDETSGESTKILFKEGLLALKEIYEEVIMSLHLQREEFLGAQMQLQDMVSETQSVHNEELSRIRIEEMVAREQASSLKSKNAKLKMESEYVSKQLEQLSSQNQMVLMEDETKAIETGLGPLQRLILTPSMAFGGQTANEFHYRLAESQFLRMSGHLGQFYVTKVEYIVNPPLLKKYNDFKRQLKDKGLPIQERLTFHGTSSQAREAILKDGFKIGGQDVKMTSGAALGSGIYSSECPDLAMSFIKGQQKQLLFCRVCPSPDSVMSKNVDGSILQLVCKSRDQIYPIYIVHFANKGNIKGLSKIPTMVNPPVPIFSGQKITLKKK